MQWGIVAAIACFVMVSLIRMSWFSLFISEGLGTHPLLDIVFAAVARAESRFSLRFVPQRSHEERLTGNLISEIEATFFGA